jgi:O-antigen/teichoic acid export membrane protein
LGIVQRQGLRNTIIAYIGLGLGFVNTVLVLPNLLAADQIGLTRVLVSVATIYAQLAAFGFASTGIRFFPYFRNKATGHQGFLPMLLGVPLLGFAVMTVAYVLGRPFLLAQYERDAALLNPYYFWGAILALFILLYSLQDAYLKALYQTSFSSLVQDILLRVLTVVAALLFSLGYLSFHAFVLAFIGSYGLATLLLMLYVMYLGEWHLRPSRAALGVVPVKEVLSFSGFVILSSLSGTIIGSIDSLMVGSSISLAATGVYTTAFFISTALTIPARSLNKIAFPLLAEYWKAQDMTRMADFYRRTTRLNTVVGCWLALGIGLNLDFIYSLMRPEFAAGATAVLLLLAGRLFDNITGVNGLILVTSPRYRFDLVFNITLAAATVLLNLLLIPVYGLTGAALATLLAMTSINVARTWFVWHAYSLQPFDWRIPLVLGIAAVAGVAAWLLPLVDSIFVTMLLRSVVLTGIYGGLLLLTRAVPEINSMLQKVWEKSSRS